MLLKFRETVTQNCRQMALEMSSNLQNMKSCIWLKSSYRTCKLRTITLSVRSAWVVRVMIFPRLKQQVISAGICANAILTMLSVLDFRIDATSELSVGASRCFSSLSL